MKSYKHQGVKIFSRVEDGRSRKDTHIWSGVKFVHQEQITGTLMGIVFANLSKVGFTACRVGRGSNRLNC